MAQNWPARPRKTRFPEFHLDKYNLLRTVGIILFQL